MCFHLSPQDGGSTRTPAPTHLPTTVSRLPSPKWRVFPKHTLPDPLQNLPLSAELSRDWGTGWGVHGSLPTQSHGPCFIFSPLPSRAFPGPWTVGNKEPQCGLLRNPEQGHIRNPYREPKPVRKTAQHQCSLIASWAFSRLPSVR